MLKLKNVSKFYYSKGIVATGFTKVSLNFELGEFIAITGESGSGKSTLLNVISGLDSYEEGEMYVNGSETSHYTEKDYESYRKKYIGNIFQNFNLVNSYTVYQNIELVLLLNGARKKDVKKKIIEIIKQVDLEKYKDRKVSKLSGGQKQRVAIARALAQDTPFILADEPTGNLDKESSKSVLELLHKISKDKLVIVVTHNYDQIKEYVTRKITMHDGKVLEDKKIKDFNSVTLNKDNEIKDIKWYNKIRLGFRNAFNIPIKFLLIFVVYSFIVFAMFFAMSSFKEAEYLTSLEGYNQFFQNTSNKRIVIKKLDNKAFTEEDYINIKKINNVKGIIKDDLSLDSYVSLSSDSYYFYGGILSLNLIDGIDEGRMPENDKEIVIEVSENDYYIENNKEDVLNSEYSIENLYDYINNKAYKVKIVGIKYIKKQSLNNYGYSNFYVNDAIVKKISDNVNKEYSEIKYTFAGMEYISYPYSIYNEILPSKKVPAGKVVISEDLSYNCKNFKCKDYSFNINLENLYYKTSLNLKVSKMYTKKTFANLTGYKYDNYNGAIFINESQYLSLFSKGFFQSSVMIEDEKLASQTITELKEYGLSTLYMPDALFNYSQEFLRILKIIKVVSLAVLIVTLFFISYFIIKIVLKSRNVYFSTLRILGASAKGTRALLNIELLVISHLSYILFICFMIVSLDFALNIEYIKNLAEYITPYDYSILYAILLLMSILITNRYSRKLFKNTVKNTYREEV
ncbi:MAG: ABC transporter ATP-binding protein [Tenericutes bacterium]|nr:ABC transporter ATP-binding protein [Mycoplasmatota bacterium]